MAPVDPAAFRPDPYDGDEAASPAEREPSPRLRLVPTTNPGTPAASAVGLDPVVPILGLSSSETTSGNLVALAAAPASGTPGTPEDGGRGGAEMVPGLGGNAAVTAAFEEEDDLPLDFDARLARGDFPGVVRGSDVTVKFIQWVWRNRLARGKVHMLDADPGVGKSTLSTDWLARISAGLAFPGELSTEPRRVVLLATEDGLDDTILPRFLAAGGDPANLLMFTEKADGYSFQLPDDIHFIKRLMLQAEAAMLVIDPFTSVLSPKLSVNNDQDVRQALMPLKQLAEETGAVIVLVRHLNKKSDTPALYRGMGSIAISGVARIAHLVTRHPEDPDQRILATTKANIGQFAPPFAFELESVAGTDVARVNYLDEVSYTADELVSPGSQAQRQGKGDKAKAWLEAYLANGPAPSEEVKAAAQKAGITPTTLRRAGEELGVEHEKERSVANGRWMMSLPAGASAIDPE